MAKLVVIVAGGSGLRMGNELPKQFLLLEGKPIILHAMDAFFQTFSDIKITLALSSQAARQGVTAFDAPGPLVTRQTASPLIMA